MKKIHLISTCLLLLLALTSCAFEKGKSQEVTLTPVVFDLNNPVQKSEFDNWVKRNVVSTINDTTANKYESSRELNFTGKKWDAYSCVFEDRNFEVYSVCSGEFGGALLFLDKKDREKIYVLSSICPKMIDFKDGKYIITSTLAHMSGSASVKILDNPRRLPLLQKDKFLHTIEQVPTTDSLLENIIDTFGLTVNVYYPYKNKGFIVFSEYQTTFVGEIQKGKIINKQPLLDYGIWMYDNKMNKIKNEIYISEINQISTSTDNEQHLATTTSIEGVIYFKQDTLILGCKKYQ